MTRAIALLLLGVALQQSASPFAGFGVVGDSGFVPDGAKSAWRLKTGETFAAGTRVWLKGTVSDDVLAVTDFERMAEAAARDIPPTRQGDALTADFAEAYAWCDHMPIMREGERRQYLVLTVKLKNRTGDALEARLARAFLSWDGAKEGDATAGISVRGKDGMGSGESTVRLDARETRSVEWRGDGLYDEGKHGRELFVTLVFAAGKERLIVRKSGAVKRTD